MGGGALGRIQYRLKEVCPNEDLTVAHVVSATRELKKDNRIHAIYAFSAVHTVTEGSFDEKAAGERTATLIVAHLKTKHFGVRIYRQPKSHTLVVGRFTRLVSRNGLYSGPYIHTLGEPHGWNPVQRDGVKRWSVFHSHVGLDHKVVKEGENWLILTKEAVETLQYVDVKMGANR